MKAKYFLIVLLTLSLKYVVFSQDSIPIIISTVVLQGDAPQSIHLRITDTLSKIIWYDTLAIASVTEGFKDTVYLDSGVYKCEVLHQDVDVDWPKIILDNGDYIESIDATCFLFSLPFLPAKITSKDSIPLTIFTRNLIEADYERFHFIISDFASNDIWYERNTIIPALSEFNDTIYLDSGTYKCEIIKWDLNLELPVIKQDDGHIVEYGYPDYEFYLFSLPGANLNSYSSISDTGCGSYTSPSSKYVWTKSGVYIDTILNHFRYDSIITINLTIITINNSVTQEQGVLTANEQNASYQWIICNSGNLIDGANSQSYTPMVNGLYAVEITKNNCEVTSSCYSVVANNIGENNIENSFLLFPNPFSNVLNLYIEADYEDLLILIRDISGRLITTLNYKNQNSIKLNTNHLNSGVYILEVLADKQKAIYKVIKD